MSDVATDPDESLTHLVPEQSQAVEDAATEPIRERVRFYRERTVSDDVSEDARDLYDVAQGAASDVLKARKNLVAYLDGLRTRATEGLRHLALYDSRYPTVPQDVRKVNNEATELRAAEQWLNTAERLLEARGLETFDG